MVSGEEKIEQHIFRFVEKELYNYPVNKKLIENYEREKKEISVSAVNTEQEAVSGTRNGRPTEVKALRLERMAARVENVRFYVRAIDDILEIITPEDREIVELKYFNGLLTNEGVMREMHMKKNLFYKHRTMIVEKCAIRMGLI